MAGEPSFDTHSTIASYSGTTKNPKDSRRLCDHLSVSGMATRCCVERQRSLLQRIIRSPKFTIKVFGIAGATSQSAPPAHAQQHWRSCRHCGRPPTTCPRRCGQKIESRKASRRCRRSTLGPRPCCTHCTSRRAVPPSDIEDTRTRHAMTAARGFGLAARRRIKLSGHGRERHRHRLGPWPAFMRSQGRIGASRKSGHCTAALLRCQPR